MDRRRFLAGVAGVVSTTVAGCTGPAYSSTSGQAGAESPTARLEMDAVSDAVIAETVTYHLREEETTEERIRLVNNVVDGGATVARTDPPLPTDTHVSFEDTVYTLSSTIVETTPATRFSVMIDILQTEVPPERTVQFADLPAVDRQIFAENGFANGEVVGIGTTLLYTDEEASKSALVPESQYDAIVWENGNEAEWVVEEGYDAPIHSYEYSAEVVATATEYGRQIREQVAFSLEDLTDRQREILQTAKRDAEDRFDGYTVGPDERPSAAFLSLTEQFRPQTQIHQLGAEPPGDLSGRYLVRDGEETLLTALVAREELFESSETGTTSSSAG